MDPLKLSEPRCSCPFGSGAGFGGERLYFSKMQAKALGFLFSLPLFPFSQLALRILPVKSK